MENEGVVQELNAELPNTQKAILRYMGIAEGNV